MAIAIIANIRNYFEYSQVKPLLSLVPRLEPTFGSDFVQATDETYQMNLLRALADDEARKIIACAISDGKSVADIVRECNIPHTSAYRLVNKLKNEGLLIIERAMLSRDGKKSLLYRSSVRSVLVKFEEGQINIDILPNRNIAERAHRLFFEARGSEHP